MGDVGDFYAIQPIPEYNPNRVKLGFSLGVQWRLKTYQSIAPNAKILRLWPCHSEQERDAIAAITARAACRQLFRELFEFDDLNVLVTTASEYFASFDATKPKPRPKPPFPPMRRLLSLMEERGMKDHEVAFTARLTADRVMMMSLGFIEPKQRDIRAIARALDVPPSALIVLEEGD